MCQRILNLFYTGENVRQLGKKPPSGETETKQETECPENKDKDEGFPDSGIKGRKCGARPIDTSIGRTTCAYGGFPATDDLAVALPKDPNPEIDVWV